MCNNVVVEWSLVSGICLLGCVLLYTRIVNAYAVYVYSLSNMVHVSKLFLFIVRLLLHNYVDASKKLLSRYLYASTT